jgi:hypothetical protein
MKNFNDIPKLPGFYKIKTKHLKNKTGKLTPLNGYYYLYNKL